MKYLYIRLYYTRLLCKLSEFCPVGFNQV